MAANNFVMYLLGPLIIDQLFEINKSIKTLDFYKNNLALLLGGDKPFFDPRI